MTREEAYNLFNNCFDRDDIRVVIKMAKEALKEPEQRWTPCSEEPKEGTYLCWEKQGFYYVDTFKGGSWELSDMVGAICIAWMPLPEPYQEGKS